MITEGDIVLLKRKTLGLCGARRVYGGKEFENLLVDLGFADSRVQAYALVRDELRHKRLCYGNDRYIRIGMLGHESILDEDRDVQYVVTRTNGM